MKIIGILQLFIGITGIALGSAMVGDIGIAAIIGAVTALLSGVGFLLPERRTIPLGKHKKIKYSIVAAGICIILALLLIGLLSNHSSNHTVSRDEFLTPEQFEQLYSDVKPIKGYQVDFYGRVFKEPDRNENYLSFQVYAQNDDRKNTIVRVNDTSVNFQEGDILHIVGEVHDMFEGKNAFGAVIKVPTIIASKFEQTDYITAFSPSLRTIEVNQTQNQNGYIMTVSKVELAKQETRVYLKVTNESTDTIDFHTYSSALVQENKQYKQQRNSHAEYPEISGDNIQPSVSSEGVIVFQAIDLGGQNFHVTFNGSSNNWEIRTDPFTFEIPLKHEVDIKSDTNNVSLTETDQNEGSLKEKQPTSDKGSADKTSAVIEIESKPLPNSLLSGKIPDIPSGIGDETITLFDVNGEVFNEVDTGMGFAYMFKNVTYYTTSTLNINGNMSNGSVTAIRFDNGQSFLGITIGQTPQEIISTLGKPNSSGIDETDGSYSLGYQFNDYYLYISAPDADSPTTTALYKMN